MDLVDHYLDTVRPMLPRAQRDDITEELADAIGHRIEDREAELGRRLKDAEVEDVLHELGHPWLVAARYQPPRHLIGPTVFPLWWLGVRFMAVIAVVATLARAGMILAFARADRMAVELFGLWPMFWGSLLFMVGVVTVIAAIAERVPLPWRVRDLPHVKLATPRRESEIAEWERWFLVGSSVLGLVTFALVPWFWTLLPPEAQPGRWAERTGVAVADAWLRLGYWAMLALCVGEVGRHLAKWKAGAGALLAARLCQAAVALGAGAIAFTIGPVFLIGASVSDPKLAEVISAVNRGAPWIAGVLMVVGVLNAGWALWMWRKGRG